MATLAEHFESTFPNGTDFSKLSDLECLLLDLPAGSYKDPEVREGWKNTMDMDMGIRPNQTTSCRIIRGRYYLKYETNGASSKWYEVLKP